MFSPDDSFREGDCIKAYRIYTDGKCEYLGKIENVSDEHGELFSCEPYAIELNDGRILCIIRVQRHGKNKVFTMYKSYSSDAGRSWSFPEQICDDLEGAPAHLTIHSSGTLILSYGHREEPCAVRCAFSRDNGETWNFGHVLCEIPGDDIGYPATIELSDKSLLTVFYAHAHSTYPAEIMQIKWKLED